MPETTTRVPVRRGSRPDTATLIRIAFAILVFLYCIRFIGPGLQGGFNDDDPMNIYYYWSRGAPELIRNLVLFFTTYQRPMGGVYFSVLFHYFGLDPFPYHVVLTVLLLINTFLAYRFARLLTGSQLAGGLTALAVAYHAEMAQLVYLPAFVFDVLCFTFYFLAFNYYLSIRASGKSLTVRQTIVFLLLSIGALESKEMAVTLPPMVFLYEMICHPPAGVSLASLVRWVRSNAIPSLTAGLLTLVFILGKTFGANPLTTFEAYRPEFTWDRYWESTTRFVNTIFYQPIEGGSFTLAMTVFLAALLLLVAWRSGRKHLLLMWCFLWIAPLPITFVPGRGAACLYIPLVGWAVTLVTIFLSFGNAVARSRLLRCAPGPVPLGLVASLGIAFLWGTTETHNRSVPSEIGEQGELTAYAIEQVRSVQPFVKPASDIYVVRSPFADWDMKFIMELVYRDPGVHVWLAEKEPLPPDAVEEMDYVFTWEDGQLKRLRGS